ncbi:MAG: hypothetical protein VW080_03645 [Flavobacteriaceae bacterium]
MVSQVNENSDRGFYDDPSLETQFAFVIKLLNTAGIIPEDIQVYQTLPNHAHVYRVRLDSVNGGFMFIRWDKKKKEHYLANKMIDPGLYYNLKAAREIMRIQTQKANFNVDDIGLQAQDQEKINEADIKDLREDYNLKQQEKKRSERKRTNGNSQNLEIKTEKKTSKNN